MANLPESSTFDANVNEILTTDLVLGGISGPANAAAINLTNRTRWLFDQNTATQAAITTLNGDVATIDAEITTINGQIASINANLASINGQLPLLAPIANPSFTGTPTAPTPGSFVNNAQLATTAYVFNWFAPIASPALTGVPTAPTAAVGTATSQLATTGFVNPGTGLGVNGYRKNPDSTIEQWGFVSTHFGAGHPDDIGITFPITFPTGIYGGIAGTTSRSFAGNGTAASGSNFTSGLSTSGMTATLEEGSPSGQASGYWRAWGH
jgi:hypothetical protein